jgi:RimJ/RimL family protein N-acetyltransferase
MSRVQFRPSVPADFLALIGSLPAYRSHSITALLDGEVVGVGGVVFRPRGEIWASCVISEKGRRYPVAVHRAGLMAIAMFRRQGFRRVYAAAEPGNAKADAWLDRLGFRPMQPAGSKLFVWRAAE